MSMQEWTKTATELSSITTYKNFSAGCGLSHAYSKDIIHLLFAVAEVAEPFSETGFGTCGVTS